MEVSGIVELIKMIPYDLNEPCPNFGFGFERRRKNKTTNLLHLEVWVDLESGKHLRILKKKPLECVFVGGALRKEKKGTNSKNIKKVLTSHFCKINSKCYTLEKVANIWPTGLRSRGAGRPDEFDLGKAGPFFDHQ